MEDPGGSPTYTCTYIHTYTYIYVYMCVYVCMHVCIHIYVYGHIYMYIHMRMNPAPPRHICLADFVLGGDPGSVVTVDRGLGVPLEVRLRQSKP